MFSTIMGMLDPNAEDKERAEMEQKRKMNQPSLIQSPNQQSALGLSQTLLANNQPNVYTSGAGQNASALPLSNALRADNAPNVYTSGPNQNASPVIRQNQQQQTGGNQSNVDWMSILGQASSSAGQDSDLPTATLQKPMFSPIQYQRPQSLSQMLARPSSYSRY